MDDVSDESDDEHQLESSLNSILTLTSTSIPFSLQEICLLYLVGHLDEYPPDTLSLLPLHLRHQLICHLSAYDLKTLENTQVTSGLDESSYWQALLEYVKQVLYPKCGHIRCYYCLTRDTFVPKENLAPKDLFLRVAAYHIGTPHSLRNSALQIVRFCSDLRYHTQVGISLPCAKLLCLPVQFPTSQTCESALQYVKTTLKLSALKYVYFNFSLGLVIPNRLDSSLLVEPWNDSSPDCALSLMKLLVNHFQYYSHHLPLDKKIYSLYGGSKDKWMIVERYLSHAELMCFNGFTCDVFKSIPYGWKNMLQSNYCACSTRLTKLTLRYCNRGNCFKNGIKVFSQQLGYSSQSLGLPRYSGLKEIVLDYVHDTKTIFNSSSHPLYKLAAIIEGQDQLKVLRLQGSFQPTPQSHFLMMVIANSFEKSTLEELKLEISRSASSQIGIASLSQIIYSYLFSPSTSDQVFICRLYGSNKIITTNSDAKIMREQIRKFRQANVVQDQKRKSLLFDTEQLQWLLPIFSVIPLQVTLSRIEVMVHGLREPDRHSCLPHVTAHSVVLRFTDTDMIYHPSSCYTIDEVGATGYALILNNHIKHLSVVSTSFPIPKSYLNSLGVILAKHAEHYQTLQSISITNANWKMKDDVDQCDLTFCEALVSLGQVVPLELKLENMDHILYTLYEVWKKKGTRKFCKLSIPETVNVSELQNMFEVVDLFSDVLISGVN